MTDVAMEDEDDWIEIEKGAAPGAKQPDVTVKLTRWTKLEKLTQARVNISLRGDAAKWLDDNGPRFRVKVGGAQLDRVRIIADAAEGRHEHSVVRGVARIAVGVVNAWPNETREPVEARWTVSVNGGFMELTLPRDFAKATPAAQSAPPAPSVAPVRPVAPVKPVAPVRPVSPNARVVDHRTYGAVPLGEPAPGRSALDQRRAAEKARGE